MFYLILTIFMLLLAGIVLTLMKKAEKTRLIKGIPMNAKPLLSNAELSFYHVIRSIIPETKEITCKCRLEDIISIGNCPERESFRNRIKSRHIDFVVFDPNSGNIEYAIELDDRSHKTERAYQTDQLKDLIFETIRIPLIRITARRTYDINEIKKILNKAASSSAYRLTT